MQTRDTLIDWLTADTDALRADWSRSVERHRHRLAALQEDNSVFERAHGLLLALAELVERPVSSNADERFKSILEDLKRLQTRAQLSPTELLVLLVTIRDAVAQTGRPAGSPARTGPTPETRELCDLLNRLGLVFLEPASGSLDADARQTESNIEYALRYERARQMAITDSLTGLSNFGYFRDRLAEERRRAERYQRLLSLIIFDLDHFKSYNDAFGHPAGNAVLQTVASILRHEARETDLVARYGGEELVIVLPETNRRTAWEVAERVRTRVREHSFGASDRQRVTLSAGVATFPVDANHDEQLIDRADASLYQAKAQGRDRVVAYQPSHRVRLSYWAEPWVERVALVGNFNNWDESADLMTRSDDGSFEFSIALTPGDYRYKFVLNGSVWTPDPANRDTQPDNMGGVNSVLSVTEAHLSTSHA